MVNMLIAVDHVKRVAADNSYGYSQSRRAEAKEDDCSSLSLDALKLAGVDIGPATYTGNALRPLLDAGFVDVSATVNKATGAGLKKYDVLLRPATPDHGGHMALMVTDTELAQAAGDLDKKRGDSSGKEIYIRNYVGSFSTPPRYVLRHPAPVPVADPAPADIQAGDYVKLIIPMNTASDGSGKKADIVYQVAKVLKVVTCVTFPYGVCYNGDGYIDGWFKQENVRK